jgi:hypothetical protein
MTIELPDTLTVAMRNGASVDVTTADISALGAELLTYGIGQKLRDSASAASTQAKETGEPRCKPSPKECLTRLTRRWHRASGRIVVTAREPIPARLSPGRLCAVRSRRSLVPSRRIGRSSPGCPTRIRLPSLTKRSRTTWTCSIHLWMRKSSAAPTPTKPSRKPLARWKSISKPWAG